MTWRDVVRPIIAAVLRKLGRGRRVDRRRAEAALFVAYPWPDRRGRRYQVWRDEVRIQLGLRRPRLRCLSQRPDLPGQKRLF
jgi:hypothetical protein